MATNKNITMKQFNGVDYDTLYPKTIASQIDDVYSKDEMSNLFLPKAGGSMGGILDMNGNRITNLPTPTSNSDPATKEYVDGSFSNPFLGAKHICTISDTRTWHEISFNTANLYQIIIKLDCSISVGGLAASLYIGAQQSKETSIEITNGDKNNSFIANQIIIYNSCVARVGNHDRICFGAFGSHSTNAPIIELKLNYTYKYIQLEADSINGTIDLYSKNYE